MDIISTKELIERKIGQLDSAKKELLSNASAKVTALCEYDKALSLTIIKLKNGVEFEIDGEKVFSPPATIIEKIAKGICYKEALEKEKTKAEYEALTTSIDILQAQLNGYQSINRHLSES